MNILITKNTVISIMVILMISINVFFNITTVEGLTNNNELNGINIDSAKTIVDNTLIKFEKYDYNIENIELVHSNYDELLFYVFHLLPEGYVVVSNNKNLPPIIAYSFLNSFNYEFSDYNVLKNILISDIELRLENIQFLPQSIIQDRHRLWNERLNQDFVETSKLSFNQWPKIGTTYYEGWIETQWSQSAPYNNFCPIDKESEDRGVAGCPAVAMAQILNYHQTTNNILFNDSDDYYHNYIGNSFYEI